MARNVAGNVFITGSAAGIGAAVTELLAERGHTVYAGVHKTAGTRGHSHRIVDVPIDVTDPDSVAAAAKLVAAAVGPDGIQAVVNNAGILVQGPTELVPPLQWRRQFDVNVLGPVHVTQSFLPLLRAGHGRVVNISAPTARIPAPFLAPIAASKAAVQSMSDSLRLELAAWGIPVSVVEPGGTQTEIFAKAEEMVQDALDRADPRRVALYGPQLAAVAKAGESMTLGPVADVAAGIVAVVTARRPKRRYLIGSGVRTFALIAQLPPALRERAVAAAMGLTKAGRVAAAQ